MTSFIAQTDIFSTLFQISLHTCLHTDEDAIKTMLSGEVINILKMMDNDRPVFLIHVPHPKEFHSKMNYKNGDQLLRKLPQMLKQLNWQLTIQKISTGKNL